MSDCNCDKKNIVPVVFSVNNKYVPYLAVVLHTLQKHVTDDNNYRLHILYTDLSDYNQARLRRHVVCTNISIEFIDVTKFITKFSLITKFHLTPETAYRLLCGDLFSQYNKILYLDCDLIIQSDVAKLYHVDIGNSYLGAVKSVVTSFVRNYVKNCLEISSSEYFNAGVLLINTLAFRRENLAERGLTMLSGNHPYRAQDQDVLNILCRGHVHYLPPSWNTEWIPLVYSYFNKNSKIQCINRIINANIVHYDSPIKPWHDARILCADLFWKEARHTEFYEEIIASMCYHIANVTSRKCIEAQRFYFPWHKVREKSKVVVYGAGGMGQSYLWQLSRYDYCTVIAVCDRNSKQSLLEDENVISPTELPEMESDYDYVIVAVYNETIAKEIGHDLLELGVAKNKLVHYKCDFHDI